MSQKIFVRNLARAVLVWNCAIEFSSFARLLKVTMHVRRNFVKETMPQAFLVL
jgi:hypothetical protein